MPPGAGRRGRAVFERGHLSLVALQLRRLNHYRQIPPVNERGDSANARNEPITSTAGFIRLMDHVFSQPARSRPGRPPALTRRSFSAAAIASLAAILLASTGCYSHQPGIEVDVRPEFLLHDRVAICSLLPRETEDFFIPLYMQAFPSQTLVERRDVNAVIGEQDILPERLDEATRAKLRRILGVKAILYPSNTKDGFAIKVIQTETGAITASVFVAATDKATGPIPMQDLVRKAIGAPALLRESRKAAGR